MALRGGASATSYRAFRTLVRTLPHAADPQQRSLRLAVLNAGGPAAGMNTATRAAAVRLGLDKATRSRASRAARVCSTARSRRLTLDGAGGLGLDGWRRAGHQPHRAKRARALRSRARGARRSTACMMRRLERLRGGPPAVRRAQRIPLVQHRSSACRRRSTTTARQRAEHRRRHRAEQYCRGRRQDQAVGRGSAAASWSR